MFRTSFVSVSQVDNSVIRSDLISRLSDEMARKEAEVPEGGRLSWLAITLESHKEADMAQLNAFYVGHDPIEEVRDD